MGMTGTTSTGRTTQPALVTTTTRATTISSTASSSSSTTSATTTPQPTVVESGQTTSASSYPGDLVLQNASKMIVPAGTRGISVAGKLTIAAGVQLVLSGITPQGLQQGGGAAPRAVVATATVPAVTAESIEGQFSTVSATPADTSGCQTATVTSQSYSATTLTVGLQLDDSCTIEGRGLSAGAIAGIAVGATIAVAVVVAAVVGAILHKRRSEGAMRAMRSKLDNGNY